MTDLQEAIVDHLMVVKQIGAGWTSGPLGLATEALDCRERRARRDVVRLFGYPLLLCQALDSANAALETVDDRRKLAITFFSEVAPRATASKLTPPEHVRTALWCAERVHPLACDADCPRAASALERVNGYLANGQWLERPRVPGCRSQLASPEGLGHVAARAFDETEATADAAWKKAWPGTHSGWAVYYAAQVAAQVKGVAGAVDFCLALARQVGLNS